MLQSSAMMKNQVRFFNRPTRGLDRWAIDTESGDKPSGAARGQSGGASKGSAGSGLRSPQQMYFHLTPEEKRRQAKLRRDAKRGKLA